MSKKKKAKKRNFSYANSGGARMEEREESIGGLPTLPTADSSLKPTDVYEVKHLTQIRADVQRVAVLAVGFIILQLLLWFMFNNTALGNAVYHLVKV